MKRSVFLALAALVAVGALLTAGPSQSAASSPLPPGQGTPESAAGINAAPETIYTQWTYTSLDNQGGNTFGQPGNERVTYVGPTEVVVVGDGALEYNHNGDSMLSADCAPAQYGPTFCIPNTGSVMHISVPEGMSKTFYCWGGSCSWWVEDSPTRLPNLVCQTLVDGCGPQGNGCYNGVYVTADWQNSSIWEHQWLGPQGPMGGVHFAEGTFGSAVLAGSCVPVPPTTTPTATATKTPVPPTPTATSVPPTPTSTPTWTSTATPTTVPPTPTSTPSPTRTPTATTVPPTATPTATNTPGCPCPTDTPTATPTVVTPTPSPTATPTWTPTPGFRKVWVPIVLRAIPHPPPTPTPAPACPAGRILFNGREGGPVYHTSLNEFRVEWTLTGGAQPPSALHWRMTVYPRYQPGTTPPAPIGAEWWVYQTGTTPPWGGWTPVPDPAVIQFSTQQLFGDAAAGASFLVTVYPFYAPGNLCAQVAANGSIDP